MLPRLALKTHLSQPPMLWDYRQTHALPCLIILPLKQMLNADLLLSIWFPYIDSLDPTSSVGRSLSLGLYSSSSLSAALGNGGHPALWGRERCLFASVYSSNSSITSIKLPAVYPLTREISTLQPCDFLLRLPCFVDGGSEACLRPLSW